MPSNDRIRPDDYQGFHDSRTPAIKLDRDQPIEVRQLHPAAHLLCFSVGSRRRSAPQVSDLIDTEGVTRARLFTGLKLIGTLPAEFQSYIIYTAAPMTNAEQPETAKAFIRFLASPQSKDAFAAAGAN